jgi:hypothetical protein
MLKSKFTNFSFYQNLLSYTLIKNRTEFQFAFEETNQTKIKNSEREKYDFDNFSILKFNEQKNTMNKNSQNFDKENINIDLNSERKNKDGGKI